MIKRLIKKLSGNFPNTVLSTIFFAVFAIIAYFMFIDVTEIDWWEKWITVIFLGIIGFCIGKLFTSSNDDNIGGGGDYFDCTCGSGSIM